MNCYFCEVPVLLMKEFFIFVIRDSFGFQDFSKILFHNFFLQAIGKNFSEFNFSMNGFYRKLFFRRREEIII